MRTKEYVKYMQKDKGSFGASRKKGGGRWLPVSVESKWRRERGKDKGAWTMMRRGE